MRLPLKSVGGGVTIIDVPMSKKTYLSVLKHSMNRLGKYNIAELLSKNIKENG